MTNNRTIYFLVDEFPRLGGAETVTDRLASELTERGERVVVLAKTSGMKLPREGAYTVEYWSPLAFALKQSVLRQISLRQVPRGLFLFALKKSGLLNKLVDISAAILIKKKIRRWNSADIVISTRADILLQLISSPAFNIRDKPLIINQFHTSLNPLGEYGAFIEEARRSLKLIDGFTVLSENCRNSFINDWCIPTLVLDNPNPPLNKFSISSFEKRIVVASRLVESKQVDIAIKAFSRFVQDPLYEDWCMEIFGDGSERHALESMVENLGVEKSVFFRGQARTPEEIFSRASIHLMTSRFEGRAMVIQEAACFGIPSIAFDVSGGTHELVKSLDGVLVQPGDSEQLLSELKKMAVNRLQLEQNSLQVRSKANQYDPSTIVDTFLRWVEQIQH